MKSIRVCFLLCFGLLLFSGISGNARALKSCVIPEKQFETGTSTNKFELPDADYSDVIDVEDITDDDDSVDSLFSGVVFAVSFVCLALIFNKKSQRISNFRVRSSHFLQLIFSPSFLQVFRL